MVRRSALPVLLLTGLLSAVLGAPEASAQSVVSFSILPQAPTAGEPITLRVTVSLPQDCGWQSAASMHFGAQAELGLISQWGLDLEVSGSADDCHGGPITMTVREDLGLLPIAPGLGVLRLIVDGVPTDLRLLDLTVAPGPAPGWGEPAFHGGFMSFTRCNALTFAPGGLFMNDFFNHAILVVDPDDGSILDAFEAPGNGDVRGLAFDGEHLYASVVGPFVPVIYELDLHGNVLRSFASPVVSQNVRPLEGLAFLHGVLYGTYESPPILFAIDPVTRLKLWQRSLPTRILALDAAPEGLLGADPGGTLYLLSPAPTGQDVVLADAFDEGFAFTQDLAGLAYDGRRIIAWDRNRSETRNLRTLALWWAADGTLHAYVPEGARSVDVIQGDVFSLAALSPNVSLGAPVCLAAGSPGGDVPAALDPPLGHAFFYLERLTNFLGTDTSYGRSFPDGDRRIDFSFACH